MTFLEIVKKYLRLVFHARRSRRIDIDENTVSIILGILVAFIVGILIHNHFTAVGY